MDQRALSLRGYKYCFKHYFDIGKNTDVIFGGIATKHGINFVELEEF